MAQKLIVLGGGHTLWMDLSQVPDLGERAVIAVNDAGAAYRGHIDYWISLHPEKLPGWMKTRKGNQDYLTVSRAERKGARIDQVVRELWRGSSGLYAVQYAVKNLHSDEVVLCGVPMTPTGHFFEQTPWGHCEKYRQGWQSALPDIKGRVTSLSGWTRDLLGPPTWAAPTPR